MTFVTLTSNEAKLVKTFITKTVRALVDRESDETTTYLPRHFYKDIDTAIEELCHLYAKIDLLDPTFK